MSDRSPDDPERRYDPDAEHAFPDGPLNELLERIQADATIAAYLEAQNINPVDRMGYNDHGRKHVEIVRNAALQLYDLLKAGGIEFNGALGQGLEEADEALIIALATTLHDIGHVVHRHQHPYYSIPLSATILDRLLGEMDRYDTNSAVKLKGEVLHAILCHHTEEVPLTREAGVVRVADALDMERGRSRIPYEKGGRGINTISSQAIRRVSLREGEDATVVVEIEMTDAAGVYQVDELLKHKLADSQLEEHVRIIAVNVQSDDLVERIEM
jgi:metal-dependent HD superfamily phosphatase/phosphodiesterase